MEVEKALQMIAFLILFFFFLSTSLFMQPHSFNSNRSLVLFRNQAKAKAKADFTCESPLDAEFRVFAKTLV